ncbi:MAG TPA: DegT/DnrJ/EryC1/StrS family aminotransferase [Vicinamibacterales bacterium]
MSARRLALLGGRPAFHEPLVVGRPALAGRRALLREIEVVLNRRWLSNNGPAVQALERRLASRLGVRHAVAVSSGTQALQVAARALGLTGEVILPSFTYVATAHALTWIGLRPVFGDVDPTTHTLDPACVSSLVTRRTSGIVGVHLWGRPCDTTALSAVARRHSLRLLFDAAHAFDCSHQGRMIGTFGDAEVFSFHATKHFTTVEGGAIVTNDDSMAGRARALRRYGIDPHGRVTGVGTNATMNEVCAAIGLAGFRGLRTTEAANRRRHQRYARQLADVADVRLLPFDDRQRQNYQFAVIEVAEAAALTRDDLLAALRAEGIFAQRYFAPGCHRLEPYRRRRHAPLPVTERLCRTILCLPTGPGVLLRDVHTVCAIIRAAFAAADAVRRAVRPGPTAGSR